MKRVVMTGSRRIEYTLVQTARSNVLLKALPGGESRVYAPKRMALREIDEVVRQNADRLLAMHEALDRRLDDGRVTLEDGARIPVEGVDHILRLSQGCSRIRIGSGEIQLSLPDPQDVEAVRAALRSALASRALERIRERLACWGPRVGGTFGRVTIREQRTRWGSCSSKHNLNFNWKLIMAPPQVLDYVVIHELCHLHEFNHSPRFWSLVRAQMPEYEVWKKWLRDHGSELHL